MTDVTSNQISTVQQVFEQSNSGEIHFGEVIHQLISIDVESYTVDYRRGETTYYFANGASIRHIFEIDAASISPNFDATLIQQAILAAQSGQVMYPLFKALTCQAGCIGYHVWITGKNVQYFGRLGESHTEKFPA
jgi:uncharacterized protein YbcV (DUF1398 family)